MISLLIEGPDQDGQSGPTKRCFKCAEVKPLTEYYRHPRMADGHLGKCKVCTRKDSSANHHAKAGDTEWVEAQRKRGRDKHHRLYSAGKNWKSPPGTKAQKLAASQAVINAVRSGRLVRPKECQHCGKEHDRIHGHHDDYSKPLEVEWLCPLCHRRAHAIHPERVKGYEPMKLFFVPGHLGDYMEAKVKEIVEQVKALDAATPADHWSRSTEGTLMIAVMRGADEGVVTESLVQREMRRAS